MGKHKWMRREYPLLAEMLFFNISDIKDNEEVNLAQLHLHRRRLAKTHVSYHKRFLPTPYRVALYQVQPNARHKMLEDARTMKLGSLPVSHMTKGGWHTLDVTPVMRELLINAQGPVELLFGIQFEAPKRPDKAYSPIVPIKHFLKNPNVFTPEHPYKASSYLVVFSETDPFFDEFEDGEDYDMTGNVIPTPPPENPSRERHMKRKILKGKQSEPEVSLNELDVGKQDKDIWKFKRMENEVYKPTRKNDGIRHKNKGNEVKRSKADELALMEKTKLKSLPFLHANEVEEIRQTSRRLTRSSTGRQKPEKKSKYAKSELISPAKIVIARGKINLPDIYLVSQSSHRAKLTGEFGLAESAE
ncbi:hypothetical protein RUM44_010555 [Polyplax serrata]|uniref:TGF-beta propeptide domain-containing protein n=1 Tax=Polyplax serrata TaxID=468196 RepID=A0ABR1AXD1_POLSC